nr:MAG TPA: hypothetical protein [Caudoviricetes sp.]
MDHAKRIEKGGHEPSFFFTCPVDSSRRPQPFSGLRRRL